MNDILSIMIGEAKKALPHSYAPYSNYHVACCIRTDNNNLYTGVNVENSSYGLTVCAETSAISQFIAAGKRTIKDVVLLNHENTFCTPCGGCRQRIFEFSTSETRIHMCNDEKILKTVTMDDLLPFAFNLQPPCGN